MANSHGHVAILMEKAMVQEPQETTCCHSRRLSDEFSSQRVVINGSNSFILPFWPSMGVNVMQKKKIHSELEYRRIGLRSGFKMRTTLEH